MSNTIKTTLLLGLMTGLLMGIGQYLGGSQGLVVAFVLAATMNFASYWFSDKIVLAMYRARPVDMNQAPELYRLVSNLCGAASLPMPRLFVIASDAPNAFATGRNPEHAAVAVTEGVLRLLTSAELEGVLAHELAHVKNRDILIGSIAATMAGVVMMVARTLQWAAMFGGLQRDDREENGGFAGLLAMTLLAPIAATLIQLAISRSREFQADATAARLSHNPLGLASALEKLHMVSQRMPIDASPQTAHLFIVSPLSGASFGRLFSTHPPIEERIERLRAMVV
ncbi:MAG: zinc metalloprotease HtpX [Deltaproteobacteria bacterium]|nr:zinc metalloprotease HtpX [Deltaproteobacteria bacterium]